MSACAQTRLESDRGAESSEAADVDHRQVVGRRLDHVTVVMHLHNLGRRWSAGFVPARVVAVREARRDA
jgi:hypothetical protein